MGYILPSSFMVLCLMPNARLHLLPKAGATQERTLEAVRCKPLFGPVESQECPLPPYCMKAYRA